MNFASIVVLMMVTAALAAAVYAMIKGKGRHCGGCCGGCSGCSKAAKNENGPNAAK